MKSVKLWAIVDTQKDEQVLCYADENKTKGQMAVYDEKPKIAKAWKPFKKAVRVNVSLFKPTNS